MQDFGIPLVDIACPGDDPPVLLETRVEYAYNETHPKLDGYGGFCAQWAFDADGTFLMLDLAE